LRQFKVNNFYWAFGKKNLFENYKNVVTLARVGESDNLQQNFASPIAPNGPLVLDFDPATPLPANRNFFK
jgi:Iap family predicted aminopeptidase